MAKRLLFGDDNSASADSAWLWVNSHDWPGWRIDVLTAVADPDITEPEHPRDLLRPSVARRLKHEVVQADPRALLRTRAEGYGLIVVGAGGHGLRTPHLGTTPDSLLDDPPAPVAIIRGGHTTHRVLLAHDDSRHALEAEMVLTEMPWADQTDVLVITVQETDEMQESAAAAAAERLQSRVRSAESVTRGPDELQIFYRPRDLILKAAEGWKADLIVIGSSGLTNWESANEWALHREDSTANAVVRHAECSVLIAGSA